MTTKLTQCLNCHKLYPFQYQHTHRQVQPPIEFRGKSFDEVIEIGSLCQHCRTWHHLGYYHQGLIEFQRQLTNHRQRRAFTKQFDEFQEVVASSLKV